MRRITTRTGLAAALPAVAARAAMSPTDVLACGRDKKGLSAVEQARQKEHRLPNTGKIFGITPPGFSGGRSPTQSRRVR
jgi:hypothetical protein